MKKTYSIIVVVLIYASITWWISLSSSGVYDIYENGDAKIYAVNAASLSRTFESSSIHVLNPYTWNDFVNAKRELGQPSALTNPGYSIMMAGIYKIVGNCRLWYGCMVSYVFYIFGLVFMVLIFARFLTTKELLFCCLLFCSNWLVLVNMIRPLTDPVFWGLALFCVWFSLKFPEKTISIGAIVGLILIMRIQAIFLYPLILILIVQQIRIKILFQIVLKLSVGSIPFFIIFKSIPWITGQSVSALEMNSESTYYLTSYISFINMFNFHDYIIKINQSIQKLSSLNVLTPIFWILTVSIFAPEKDPVVARLRWFSLIGVVSLILVGCLGAGPSSRLYLLFVPFIIATSFLFVKALAMNFSSTNIKKYIYPLIIVYFMFSTSSGLLTIATGYCNKSPKNITSDVWQPFENYLDCFKPEAIIATNCIMLPLFHETRNIVPLPDNIDVFINESQKNKKLDALIFFFYRDKKTYLSWKKYVCQDTIIDAQKNEFRKSFEINILDISIKIFQISNK